MPDVEMIRTLYRYNAWANQHILDAAEHLSTGQLVAHAGASFDTVRDTLVHTMSVERLWLARFQQIESPTMFRGDDYPGLGAIREQWSEIEARTLAFVTSIDDHQLAKTIHYVNAQGEPNAYPLWQMMVHQVNHAMLLTQFGYSPG